uniref:DUF3730 domain-containing protein n=1 Tax=Anopheles farauti TaxID=69004 RepID=A0A182R082_9DIPT
MDTLQAINSKLTVQSAAVQIEKVLKIAHKSKTSNRTVNEGDIELLKQLCKSNNLRTCQLANEAILQLAGEGSMELGQALGMLITLLPNTNAGQFIPLSGVIFELLLLDLRRRCTAGSNYTCQFDLIPPQHPIILLFNKASSLGCTGTVLELIVGVLQYRDDTIRTNSVEFLRPVLLHLFVNMSQFSDCQPIWKLLVQRSLQDPKAISVLYEIIAWRRDTTAPQTAYTVAMLTDALEIFRREQPNDIDIQLPIALYLAVVLKEYVEYNYDPNRCFALMHAVFMAVVKCDPSIALDVMLTIAADMLSVLTPSKVCGLLEIIQTILPTCSKVSCMVMKEALIQLLGQPSYTTRHLAQCDKLLQAIENQKYSPGTELCVRTVFFHADLAKWTILSNWWTVNETATEHYLQRCGSSGIRFTVILGQLHRSIFLSPAYEEVAWRRSFDRMVNLMKHNELHVAQSMVPLLYGLAQQKDARRRLHILQTIASMGAKENLIGILKALTKDLDRALCLDLYLRLWKAEPRTYPLLYDLLKDTSRQPKEDHWEHTIARAYTIREVCLIKPQQHGEDLVNLFSEVLSNPKNNENEVAICLSLDAISSLCENHVVNIVSTWKVLGFRFANERRPKVIKSLCRFFASVPLIKITSIEQERLVNHIIGTLWHYVTDYEDREIIEAALGTLKHFNPELLTLRQIPEVFRQGIELLEASEDDADISPADSPGSVPPECWIQLLQYTNHCAIDAVGDLVAHYITREVETYRGGIYQTPEGRPEPSNLKYLPRASILSTIVNYLIVQSTKFAKSDCANELVLVQMLRIVAKPYPKPIPPLNWCFLHEYFHHCFEMRDACLQIAFKQMPYSGTAKRLVENYLSELCETIMLEEDLLKIYAAIADVTETLQPDIYKRFVHLSLQYLAERAEDAQFPESASFVQAMALIGQALRREKKYENEDNFQLLCTTLENFFMRFTLDSETFRKYIETLVHLPAHHFESLLKPSTWKEEINEEKLRKTIYLQFAFLKHNPTAKSLHFHGLADIVTTVAKRFQKDPETCTLLSEAFFNFVEVFTRDNEQESPDVKALVGFMAELIGLIQCALTVTDVQIQPATLFMIDMLMVAVVSFSGYGGLYGEQAIALDHSLRLSLFPVALVTTFQHNVWREIEIKVYEFLYHLCGIASLPKEYAVCLRNALICCKKQPYFQQPKTWPKFVTLRDF